MPSVPGCVVNLSVLLGYALMNYLEMRCLTMLFAAMLFGGNCVLGLQAAESPLDVPLDANNPFLGEPIFDAQKI